MDPQASLDWMTTEIVQRHRDGDMKSGVPNPSLTKICELVSRAACSITPAVQRRAFENTGLTLKTDGSEDHKLSNSLRQLLSDHHQDPVPRGDFISYFFNRHEIRYEHPSIAKIFKVLGADAAKAKEEDFQRIPVAHKMKTDQKYVSKVFSNTNMHSCQVAITDAIRRLFHA